MNQFVVSSHQSGGIFFFWFTLMINTRYSKSVSSAYDKHRASKPGCRMACWENLQMADLLLLPHFACDIVCILTESI